MKYVILALALSGCASMSREMKTEEIAWQALNVADVVITDNALRNHPTLTEDGIYRLNGGSRPSTIQFAESMVIFGAAHFAVSGLLAKYDTPRWLQRSWQFISISNTGIIIGNNIKKIENAP